MDCVKAEKYTSYSYPCIDYEKLEDILTCECPDRRLSVYGFGHFGKMLFDTYLWNKDYTIECFVDANSEKYINEKCCGIPIIAPPEFAQKNSDLKIIVSVFGLFDEVCKYLMEIGIERKNIIALPFKNVSGRILKAGDRFDAMSAQIGYASCLPDEPIVTVVSIIYNTPLRLLRRAIESVLSQVRCDYTYTIIDNGSTGETKRIISEYANKDKRIRIIRYDENVSSGDPCRLGSLLYKEFNKISTKYCCFLDSDDYYTVDFLEKTIPLAEANNADVVKVQTMQISEDKSELVTKPIGVSKSIVADSKAAIAETLLQGFGYMGLWGALWKTRTILNTPKPDLESNIFIFLIDYYWVLNALKNSECVVMLNDVLHFQTVRQGSASRIAISRKEPWIATANVLRGYLSLEIISSTSILEKSHNYFFQNCLAQYMKSICELTELELLEIKPLVDLTKTIAY